MNIREISSLQKFFNGCFLAYLAVLPMSSTTALRNLLLYLLVCSVLLVAGFGRNYLEFPMSRWLRHLPLIFVLWIVFLLLFPLWAAQSDVAWKNIKGQWTDSMLAWTAGFGAVLLLGRRGPGLWTLALASAFPLAVHLLLFVAGRSGFLTAEFYASPTMTSLWHILSHQATTGGVLAWDWQRFPKGFWGIEPTHVNLGYAACQAIALFGVCFAIAWQENNRKRLLLASLSIVLCFTSIVIAKSRAAIFFGLMILALTALIHIFKCHAKDRILAAGHKKTWRSWSRMGGVAVLVLLLISAFQTIRHDVRWYSMADKVKIGFLSEKPLDILCNGVSSQMEAQIRENFAGRDPAYMQVLLEGITLQDGGRILLMRAGLDLVLENPWGVDGSRHSYQKLINEKCGHEPVLHFSHSHQGWIDIALALGWAGVLIFAAMMLYFLFKAWPQLENIKTRLWALSLFLLGLFWILRGFTDSVYREHYLQMQSLMLAYLFWRLTLEKNMSLDSPQFSPDTSTGPR